MAQHATDEGVQEAACDAFIAIGRNANLEAFVQTNAAELLVKARARARAITSRVPERTRPPLSLSLSRLRTCPLSLSL